MKTRLLALALLSSLSLATSSRADQRLDERKIERLENRLVEVAGKARAATVGISGLIGIGSGVIVDRRGLVLTNAHVAAAAPWAVVHLADGRRLLARRLGIYYPRDLSLYRLPQGSYPHLALGGRVAKGDWVLSLGHPGGIKPDARPAVCAGMVTGRAPVVRIGGLLDYTGGIASDLPIYFGNSGGPMVSLDGKLAGINGAMNPASGASYTQSPATIRKTMEQLAAGEVIVGPSVRLRPDRWYLRPFFRMLDALALRVARARLGGVRQRIIRDISPQRLRWALQVLARRIGAAGGAPIWRGRHAASRQRLLLGSLQGAVRSGARAVFEVRAAGPGRARLGCYVGKGLGVIPGVHAPGAALGDGLRVVAASQEHGLSLVALGAKERAGLSALRVESPGPPGAMIVVPGPGGEGLACGVVSVTRRSVHLDPVRVVAEATQQVLVERLSGWLGRAPRWTGLRQLHRMIERMRGSRRILQLGSLPRSYREVFQHDAPVHPRQMGGPVVDRHGKWIGVNVSRAHHGTTYAVPARAVLEAFARNLR